MKTQFLLGKNEISRNDAVAGRQIVFDGVCEIHWKFVLQFGTVTTRTDRICGDEKNHECVQKQSVRFAHALLLWKNV